MPEMRFPNLIKDRNITYERALRGEKAQLERLLFQATTTGQMTRRNLRGINAELKRWATNHV